MSMPRVLPHPVLIAVAALLTLAGCGVGAAGTPVSNPAAPPTVGSTGTGSGGPPGPASTAVAGLTGNLCTDFAKIKYHVPTIPPGDKGNLPALRQDAKRLLTAAAAYFNALAGESPPSVATALRTLASSYQQDVAIAESQNSAASLEHLIQTAQYSGPALAALRVVAHYIYLHCT